MKMGGFEIEGAQTGRFSGKGPSISDIPKDSTLKVTSIFLSVDGEVNPAGQGAWSVFIRLAGCTAGCKFCDTKYSWKGGTIMPVDEIQKEVKRLGAGKTKVTITGGEPMEQEGPALKKLIGSFLDQGQMVTIETNGLHPVRPLLRSFLMPPLFLTPNPNLSFILDWKLPSAGKVAEKMNPRYYFDLPDSCFIKFVISNRLDFDCAMTVACRLHYKTKARLYFSPAEDGVDPEDLFQWMKEENAHLHGIGYNLQLHKFIFSDDWRDEEG